MTEAACLSFRDIPHSSALFADYISNFERVRAFYPLSPSDTTRLLPLARNLNYSRELRTSVAVILSKQNRNWGASAQAQENIARLRNGASAIVTGQQIALFGGPAYSPYKALTAIKLAEQLTQAGQDCVPIFWLATEDHDFAEISQTKLRSPSGELKNFSLVPTADDGTPVGGIFPGEQIQSLAQQAAAFLGAGPASDLLKLCYTPGETLGNAFAKLFTRIFSHYGLILLDPSDSEFHELAKPIYAQSIAQAGEITNALLERGKALEQAGYHQQVKITNSSTLLFALENGLRTPIRRANGNFVIDTCKLSAADLQQRIAAQPQEFNPNALLRPVMQDFLLPTLAYIGGLAEVAYFAQASVIYERLLGRVTPILPRFSATLIDARAQRLLQRYRIQFTDLLNAANPRELLAGVSLPPQLGATFASVTERLEAGLAELSQSLSQLDPTLNEAAQHSASKIRYQLQRLRGRAARASLRRNDEISRHADLLMASLYPNKNLQEREIAGISYLAQFGTELLPRLYDAIQPACTGHQIILL